ncbi:hypothetical protein [Polyangium sp. 15x6]|uniref:hypothetical protein n=1 Tax=Polyangium sp. 15x6 TaxID=3042687 RepID=UPI00249CB9B0|nr:hypothetical protein [Polyangium sp. 15x6]MDI3290999.1 hypothetical protein [Polyangium sp. 15x6]
MTPAPEAFRWLGIAAIAFGTLHFVVKLHVSKTTKGGTEGMVPIMDGCVFPSIFWTLGLAALQMGLPWWTYPLLWIALTVISGWALIRIGRA